MKKQNIHNFKNLKSALYVEDEEIFQSIVGDFLEKQFKTFMRARTYSEAENFINQYIFDFIFLDKFVTGGQTLPLVPKIKSKSSETSIIVLTVDTQFSGCAQAYELGVDEYIPKPVNLLPDGIETDTFLNDFLNRSLRANETSYLFRQNESLLRQLRLSNNEQLIGRSDFVQALKSQILNCSGNTPVLITGTIGTGKSLVASLLYKTHGKQDQNKLPFISLHCQTGSPDQIELSLFGHKSGAFPGSIDDREGSILKANTGYLILEEISELSFSAQERLIQILKNGYYQCVGEENSLVVNKTETKIRFRLIATSRKNLRTLVDQNLFNSELLNLLSCTHIRLEPLETHRDDIPDIASSHLLKKHGVLFSISEKGKKHLKLLHYDANIKELLLRVEVAVLKARLSDRYELFPEDFELNQSLSQLDFIPQTIDDVNSEKYNQAINKIEKQYLEASLKLYNYNKKALSTALNISLVKLYSRLNLHKLRGKWSKSNE